jgi:hypothetical protein
LRYKRELAVAGYVDNPQHPAISSERLESLMKQVQKWKTPKAEWKETALYHLNVFWYAVWMIYPGAYVRVLPDFMGRRDGCSFDIVRLEAPHRDESERWPTSLKPILLKTPSYGVDIGHDLVVGLFDTE